MRKIFNLMWREEEGVLSFEWTMLTSLLTIGIVSGVSAVRDATIDELGDVAQAMVSLDQSYVIEAPLGMAVHSVGYGWGWGWSGGWGWGGSAASGSAFVDAASFADCYRPHMKVQEFPRRTQPGPGGQPEATPMPDEGTL